MQLSSDISGSQMAVEALACGLGLVRVLFSPQHVRYGVLIPVAYV